VSSCDPKILILSFKIFRLPRIWLGRQADYVLLQFNLQYFGSHQCPAYGGAFTEQLKMFKTTGSATMHINDTRDGLFFSKMENA